MKKLENKTKVISFIISLLYVGLGTVGILCIYPPYYGDWVLLVLLFTFPVTIIGAGVMFTGKYYIAVIFVQIIVFFLFWHLLSRLLYKHSSKNGNIPD